MKCRHVHPNGKKTWIEIAKVTEDDFQFPLYWCKLCGALRQTFRRQDWQYDGLSSKYRYPKRN